MRFAPPAVRLRRIVALSLYLAIGITAAAAQEGTLGGAATSELISISDNRTAAGTLRDGTLTVRLEARLGRWHPDADSGASVEVKAFAAEGAVADTGAAASRYRRH